MPDRKKDNPNIKKTKKAIGQSSLFQLKDDGPEDLNEIKKETNVNKKSNSEHSSSKGTDNSTKIDTIILKKEEKTPLIQRAYYLREDQIFNIDKISDETGLDKSHLIRKAIDEFIKRVEY